MMIVVLDTNIFVSGIHWTGSSRKILDLWLSKRIIVVTSLQIIEEVMRVLTNFKITLHKKDLLLWESVIFEKTHIVVPTEKVDIIRDDPDDNKFIEAALEAKAKYIISQDKHLLVVQEYRDIKIVHPDEFMGLMEAML